MQKIAREDESGDLRTGAFFEFFVPMDRELYLPEEKFSPVPPIWSEMVPDLSAADVIDEYEEMHDCPVDPSHVTGLRQRPIYLDIQQQTATLTDFVPTTYPNVFIIISDGVKKALESTGFRGYAMSRVPVNVCYPDELKEAVLWNLDFLGSRCERRPIIVPPKPNVCPFCGFGPLVCTGCNQILDWCPKCRKKTIVLESQYKGSQDKRYVAEPSPAQGRILDGQRWDGADFIRGGLAVGFVSSRVIRWLLDNGFYPFVAWPARMDVTEMSPERREEFDRLVSIQLY